uniref:(northern house mosquito) hypothetical protein n=1 Tax=Culex pipiens TaxID=7175 RepID=A0A8D8G3I7_CULPI
MTRSSTRGWPFRYCLCASPSRPIWCVCSSSRCSGCSSRPAPTSGCSMCGTQIRASVCQPSFCGFCSSTWRRPSDGRIVGTYHTSISVDPLRRTALATRWSRSGSASRVTSATE